MPKLIGKIFISLLFFCLVLSLSATKTLAIITPTPPNFHSITLNPIADAQVLQSNPAQNFGGADWMAVGGDNLINNTVPEVRGLIRFSMSEIPANSTITKATLRLMFYTNPDPEVSYYFRAVGSNWVESSVNWNTKPSTLFSPPPTLMTRLSNGFPTNYKEIPIDQIVQAWVNRQITNYGIEISASPITERNYRHIRSREFTAAKPELIVEYTSPGLTILGPVISTILASPITSTTATINWNTSNINSNSYVDYWTDPANKTTKGQNDSVTQHGVNLDHLTPLTTYNYWVRSKGATGPESTSAIGTFKTKISIVLFTSPTPTPTPSPTTVPNPEVTATPTPITEAGVTGEPEEVTPADNFPTGGDYLTPPPEDLSGTPTASAGGLLTSPTPKPTSFSLFGAFSGKNLLVPVLIILFLGFLFLILLIVLIAILSKKKKTNPQTPITTNTMETGAQQPATTASANQQETISAPAPEISAPPAAPETPQPPPLS